MDDHYTVFTDESGTGDRFLGLGALILPAESVADAEALLEEFARARGFHGRELSWKKCSREEVTRYADFVELFWHLHQALSPIDFRCLVIDTQTNPLRHDGFGCTTKEEGFYKFYHHFLSASIRKTAWKGSRFTFKIASTTDRYPHRTEILTTTVRGALNRVIGSRLQSVMILRPEPRQQRLHQLTDVLLGAVTHRANSRCSAKSGICERIEGYVRKPLTHDFYPAERPFNIWCWASKQQNRWAPGSRGTVR
jgi:hypothetical protein